LIELIRNRLITVGHLKWVVHLGWVKGHAGLEGNELVDRLAKEAAVEDGPVVYDKIPKKMIVTREKDHGLQMWEQQWMDTRRGALTKAFFPISEKEANTENTDISRINYYANRTW